MHRIVSVTDQSKHPLLIIVMLAWPIFVEQVLVSLVQSVDTAMVGALGANGHRLGLHQPKPDQPDQLGDHGSWASASPP